MEESVNRMPGNILMTAVVFITLIIGLTGIVRSILGALQIELRELGVNYVIPGNYFISDSRSNSAEDFN